MAAIGGVFSSSGSSIIPEGYHEIVFSDEFNSVGEPDSTKWNFEEGYLRNGELQRYTTDNAFCENGKLIIELRKDDETVADSINGHHYTSASISTANLAGWRYGYIEVRAKVPSSLGVWPAIKLLPSHQVYGGWPRSGELDVMESVGHMPEHVHFTAHSERFNYVRSTQRRKSVCVDGLSEDFHVYALEWLPDCLKWYVDGKEQFKIRREATDDWTTWPFDTDFFLAINLAYGGSWGGVSGTDAKSLPQRFEIDYVRIFK